MTSLNAVQAANTSLAQRLMGTILTVVLMASASIIQAGSSAQTKYPVVLVHGLSGFDSVMGEYFYGIRGSLQNEGAQVFTPQWTAFTSNEAGGEELLAYVEAVVAYTGKSKVNLIGHSQGGLVSRYVAAVRPDLVASVTSVGSPHFGSAASDVLKDSPLEGPAVAIGNAVGSLVAGLSGDPEQGQNALGAMASLSTEGMASFNASYPQGIRLGRCRSVPSYNAGSWWWPNWVKDYSVNDGDRKVNGVRYYSWSGVYNPVLDSNVLDPFDGVMAVTSLTHGESNDGLVARCSSHMGKVIRDDYVLNHADEINGFFGLRGLWSSNPVSIFVSHANRLKNAGL